jgi:cell wall assembly regulator SMI1
MDERLQDLVAGLEKRPPADVDALLKVAAGHGVELPPDYVEFMAESDGGDGDIGSRWLELWSVDEITETAEAPEPRYDGVLLFAGDGSNTVYGFDSLRGNEIVEGDWIGLRRDELIARGRTLTDFLRRLAAA